MRISDWSSDVCSSDLIELRCDLRDIAVTVIVGSIDSQQPHTLFIGRFERITVNNSRIINENGSRLALPPLQLIEQTSERENRQDWQRDLLVLDRKSVVWGKSVSVRVDLGGLRIIKKKKKNTKRN